MKIVDHSHPLYQLMQSGSGDDRWNGAYYYSREIVKNIIPLVHTDRNWMTVNVRGAGYDHSIVFIHNNLHPEIYAWLKDYHDLILVCGIPETCVRVAHLGTAVCLPLSVDTEYVRSFTREKTKDTAFVGRRFKREGIKFPDGTDFIEGLPRDELLEKMSSYRRIYAVGRTAVEAKVLDCEILPYDSRFPDPGLWKPIDNRDAAARLQYILDSIDGRCGR